MPSGQEDVYLHYNVLFGVDKIGQSWQIFYLPTVGLAILTFNLFLGWLLYKHEKFLAQMLNFFSLVCQIFLVIGAALLIFLNI